MPLMAEIRCNATGEVREITTTALLVQGVDFPDDFIWIWEGGNYSCDCNRRIFFARAAGEKEDWGGPCSEGLYSVRLRDKESGLVWYDEFNKKFDAGVEL